MYRSGSELRGRFRGRALPEQVRPIPVNFVDQGEASPSDLGSNKSPSPNVGVSVCVYRLLCCNVQLYLHRQ